MQPEGDVVGCVEVREQQVVLEHDAYLALLGWHEGARTRVVEHLIAEGDPAFIDRLEPSQAPQQRGLAGSVGPEDREDPAGFDRQLDVEVERAQLQLDGGRESHVGGGLRHWVTQ